jgi:chromosome segregation ATPase
MAFSSSSQTDWPKWIQFKNDTVAGFTRPQTEKIGEKLVIKDHLIVQNYELSKQVEKLTEKVEALQGAVDQKNTQIAQLEADVRNTTGQMEQYKALHTEKKQEADKWYSKYEKMKGRRNTWRGIALTEAVILVVATVTGLR